MIQSNNTLPDEVLYNSCGGCGATNPLQRCIGCFHPFEKKLTEEYKSLCDKYRELKDRHDTLATVLQEFVSKHEAGLLPDRFVYDKAIKILNDGK